MASVTQRIKEIQQPYGGYLPVKKFVKRELNDGIQLNEEDNIHASLVGLAVDYLTRYMMGASADKAFHISVLGAKAIRMQDKAEKLKKDISGLDDKSIISACKLAGFDVCYRASLSRYKPIEDIQPDLKTIENIRIMVRRSITFFEEYGPVVTFEPTFEGGYTETINVGDGDFLTENTLWDFKVSKRAPIPSYTLQLLIYYIMGLHSTNESFNDIQYLGFFNPRLNVVYTCSVTCISSDTIKEIEQDVICYKARRISHRHETHCSAGFSVDYLSDIIGERKSDIYADIRSGKLTATKVKGKYFIPESECDRYAEEIKKRKIKKFWLIFMSVILGILSTVLLLLFI